MPMVIIAGHALIDASDRDRYVTAHEVLVRRARHAAGCLDVEDRPRRQIVDDRYPCLVAQSVTNSRVDAQLGPVALERQCRDRRAPIDEESKAERRKTVGRGATVDQRVSLPRPSRLGGSTPQVHHDVAISDHRARRAGLQA
jgi:hypothetical protein